MGLKRKSSSKVHKRNNHKNQTINLVNVNVITLSKPVVSKVWVTILSMTKDANESMSRDEHNDQRQFLDEMTKSKADMNNVVTAAIRITGSMKASFIYS